MYTYDYDDKIIGFSYDPNINISNNEEDYFYLRNQLGDISHILDASGNTVVHYVYDAYGNIVKTDITSGYGYIAEINSYTYRGYRYDSEINMYYLNSRYYNPEVGRFINSDAVLGIESDILSTNMYAYGVNNPIMNIDPSGYLRMQWQSYITNSELRSWFLAAAGSMVVLNQALYSSGATLLGIIIKALSNFKLLATIGAIPVWGTVIFIAAIAVVTVSAAIIVAALVQGKGIKMWANVNTRWLRISVDIGLRIQ